MLLLNLIALLTALTSLGVAFTSGENEKRYILAYTLYGLSMIIFFLTT